MSVFQAVHMAEAYVLSLFHLYQTVYFHKPTRCAEKLFAELLVRLDHHPCNLHHIQPP